MDFARRSTEVAGGCMWVLQGAPGRNWGGGTHNENSSFHSGAVHNKRRETWRWVSTLLEELRESYKEFSFYKLFWLYSHRWPRPRKDRWFLLCLWQQDSDRLPLRNNNISLINAIATLINKTCPTCHRYMGFEKFSCSSPCRHRGSGCHTEPQGRGLVEKHGAGPVRPNEDVVVVKAIQMGGILGKG